jgi:hypothetical protein
MSPEFSFPTVMYGILNLLPIPIIQPCAEGALLAGALNWVDGPAGRAADWLSSSRCSAHNLIKLRIGNGLVRISAGWSESCWNLWLVLHPSLEFAFKGQTTRMRMEAVA